MPIHLDDACNVIRMIEAQSEKLKRICFIAEVKHAIVLQINYVNNNLTINVLSEYQ